MKTKFIVLASLLLGFATLCLASDKGEKVKGNGHIITRTIPVEDFQTLYVGEQINSSRSSGGLNFFKKKQLVFNYMQTLGAATLQITTDENIFDELVVEQKKGKLRIGAKDRSLKLFPTHLVINGSSSGLEKIQLTGCLDFVSESLFQAPSLVVSLSGVGDVKMDELHCDTLDCNVSGVGNLYLTGKVEQGSFDLSGVGRVYAFDCRVKELECDVSGVGSMEVQATDRLKARVSGVGKLKYKGDAKVSKRCSGVGRIKHIEN